MKITRKIELLNEVNSKKDFPLKIIRNSEDVFCNACEKSFGGGQRGQILQHLGSVKHKQNIDLKVKRTMTQAQLEDLLPSTKVSKYEILGKKICSPGLKGEEFQLKMTKLLEKNPGITFLSKIVNILEGKEEDMPNGLSPKDVCNLKYCPIVSVDVERSFSWYKNILSDNRRRFIEENLSKYMICHAFYAINEDK